MSRLNIVNINNQNDSAIVKPDSKNKFFNFKFCSNDGIIDEQNIKIVYSKFREFFVNFRPNIVERRLVKI